MLIYLLVYRREVETKKFGGYIFYILLATKYDLAILSYTISLCMKMKHRQKFEISKFPKIFKFSKLSKFSTFSKFSGKRSA